MVVTGLAGPLGGWIGASGSMSLPSAFSLFSKAYLSSLLLLTYLPSPFSWRRLALVTRIGSQEHQLDVGPLAGM